MSDQKIDILLATFNGAHFLSEQIESLLAQTYSAFRVLISDDGSSDETPKLIEDFVRRHPGRVVFVPNPQPGQGAIRNFEHLLKVFLRQGVARWFAFADQDDCWLPDKLAISVAKMAALEDGVGQSLPCLIHTDLCVVNGTGRILHSSLADYEGLHPGAATRDSLLSVNEVTGCTLLGNRRLAELALPFPDAAIMHDWWCAVVAGSGRRAFIPRATVLYRQHGANQIGARNRSIAGRAHRLWTDAAGVRRRIDELSQATWYQAFALHHRLCERGLDAAYVKAYLRWRSRPRLAQLPKYRQYYAGPELDRLSRWWFWRPGIDVSSHNPQRTDRICLS